MVCLHAPYDLMAGERAPDLAAAAAAASGPTANTDVRTAGVEVRRRSGTSQRAGAR